MMELMMEAFSTPKIQLHRAANELLDCAIALQDMVAYGDDEPDYKAQVYLRVGECDGLLKQICRELERGDQR